MLNSRTEANDANSVMPPNGAVLLRLRYWFSESLGRRVSFFVLLIALGFALAIGVPSFFYTKYLLESNVKSSLQTDAWIAANAYAQNISSFAEAVKALAKNSLVVNAVVDSGDRQAYLIPFIRSFRFGDDVNANLLLTDFSGNPIASIQPTRSYSDDDWRVPVVDRGQPKAIVERRENRSVLVLAFPVVFPSTSLPEGMLIGELDLNEIGARQMARPENENIKRMLASDTLLVNSSETELSDQNFIYETRTLNLGDPMNGLGLRAIVGKSRNEALRALHMYTLGYLGLSLLLITIMVFLTRWSAVRMTEPIVTLSRTAERVTENIDSTLPASKMPVSNDEVGKLHQAVYDMVLRLRSARDDLERKVSERTYDLQKTHSRLNALISNNPMGIMFENNAGVVEVCNSQLKILLGIDASATNLTSTSSSDFDELTLGVVKDSSSTLAKTKDLRAARQPSFNDEIVLNDGRTLERDFVPIYVENEFIGLLWIYRDISERKKVERLKNEFVSIVSHELRTPLTSIKGSLGLIYSGAMGDLNEEIKNMIHLALRNSDRLGLLVNDILDMDKIASGKLEFNFKNCSLPDLVNQSLENNRAYGEQYKVEMVSSATPPDVYVYVDSDRFLQVMANLLSNAAKFSKPGDSVEVHCAIRDRFVRVSVIDRGSGVPEEFRGRIFQKFSQADSSDTRAKGGTGLGLSITKVLVERMGGKIDYNSVIGEGSEFYFDLPIVES